MKKNIYLKIFVTIIICLFVCNSSCTIASQNLSKQDFFLQKAKECFEKGDNVVSIKHLRDVLRLADTNHKAYWEALIRISQIYKSTGNHNKALSVLKNALPVIEQIKSPGHKANFFNSLGDVYLSIGNMQQAAIYFEKGILSSKESNNHMIQASLLNNIGNAYMSYGQQIQNEKTNECHQKALSAYRSCIEILNKKSDNQSLKANVTTNMVLTEFYNNNYKSMINLFQKAYEQNFLLQDNIQKVDNLLSLVWISIQVIKKNFWSDNISLTREKVFHMAYEMANKALIISNSLNNLKYKSESNGYMGQLYEIEGRYKEALTLTRKAVFFSQQAKRKDLLYYWQSQSGRLFILSGETDKAVKSYENAIETLKPIQLSLLTGLRNNARILDNKIKPVYLGLSKIYFERAKKAKKSEIKKKYLKKAWGIMEQMKITEIQNFYKDECVAENEIDFEVVKKIPAKTAIIYPVLFNDHPVILIRLLNSFKHFTLEVDTKEIKNIIYRFSHNVRNWGPFEDDAKTLYKLLIHPIESYLKENKIDTLVVAADGGFCLVPFAALLDEDLYLIEKYALVTIPAIALTNINPVSLVKNKALLAGFSKGSSNKRIEFSPLPQIKKEIKAINKIVGGKILIDEEFSGKSLKQELNDNSFSIIHLATHGKFGMTPDQTFLISSDGLITLNDLEHLLTISTSNERPVELLTLSACETATGNERLAFGMAGIAVKSGVKSVIATLWPVDDIVAYKVLTEFYNQFSKKGLSKAKALQKAQKKLLERPQFYNPTLWASFLLIGNWL